MLQKYKDEQRFKAWAKNLYERQALLQVKNLPSRGFKFAPSVSFLFLKEKYGTGWSPKGSGCSMPSVVVVACCLTWQNLLLQPFFSNCCLRNTYLSSWQSEGFLRGRHHEVNTRLGWCRSGYFPNFIISTTYTPEKWLICYSIPLSTERQKF